MEDLDYDVLDVYLTNGMVYSAEIFLYTSREQEAVEITRKGKKEDDILYHLEPAGFEVTRVDDVLVDSRIAEVGESGRSVNEEKLDRFFDNLLPKYAELDRSKEYDFTDGELTNPLL